MDINTILNQLFEESRYHRRFHHTIFTLFITLYMALLGYQLANMSVFEELKDDIATIVILISVLYLVIPFFVIRTILNYHITIANLNGLIAYMMFKGEKTVYSAIAETHSDQDEHLKESLDAAFFRKYLSIVEQGTNPATVGRGHKFFIAIFLILVITNLFLFIWPKGSC